MKQFIIYISLLLASCGSNPKKETVTSQPTESNTVTLTKAQYKNAGIETGTIETQSISSVIKLMGKIEVPPQNMVSISAPLGGYLKRTKLLPGMHISKGEVLATMEDPQYIQLQQDYLTAKANFAFNKSEYERQKDLNESKAASDKVYEQAKATYQTQLILIKSLEQKLKLIGINPQKVSANSISQSTHIYSPISGFVSAVNVNIGKYVNPSDVLFELVNPADIHLALTVFDKDLNRLAIGQKLYAYNNTNPQKKYLCEIILISKNLSDNNSTQVHCHFEQYDKTLLPGMFMNADAEISSKPSHALPEDAVVRFENKNYIFSVKGENSFEMQEVQIGNTENGFCEIQNAAQFLDSKIVLKGAYTLLMTLKNIGDD